MGDPKRSRRSASDGSSGASEDALDALSFEGALDQLEGTVSRLEEGEMPLEEALELFETGVKLSRRCSATLEAAERRIEILMAGRDAAGMDPKAVPFDSALEDDEPWDEADDGAEDFED